MSPKLKALGHPVRLGIALRLAAEGGTCACDFAEIFGISQPAVSQHLKVLREAGLVKTRRDGTQIYYSLDVSGVRVLQRAIAQLAAEITPVNDHGLVPPAYIFPQDPSKLGLAPAFALPDSFSRGNPGSLDRRWELLPGRRLLSGCGGRSRVGIVGAFSRLPVVIN